ncbi:DUF3551 domain-containing protein [Bradyrhizobium sp. STM 3562]|uniref:DUF3551 domain-containing protein n=1 Tax=Bradyrhizobium sp. STM 3562 TaxID=578924 RepID=UPI003890ECEA
MRTLVLLISAILVVLGVTAMPMSASAQSRQWCARQHGVLHCMYETEDQCRASVSGRHGTCVRRHR